jgi:hypothetical protein
LGQGKRDVVLGLVLSVFILIPLKTSFLHKNNILRRDKKAIQLYGYLYGFHLGYL